MTNNHSNRTLRYYITVLLVILMSFLILIHSDLSAKEKVSGFVFNSESAYWPTKGWKISELRCYVIAPEFLPVFGNIS